MVAAACLGVGVCYALGKKFLFVHQIIPFDTFLYFQVLISGAVRSACDLPWVSQCAVVRAAWSNNVILGQACEIRFRGVPLCLGPVYRYVLTLNPSQAWFTPFDLKTKLCIGGCKLNSTFHFTLTVLAFPSEFISSLKIAPVISPVYSKLQPSAAFQKVTDVGLDFDFGDIFGSRPHQISAHNDYLTSLFSLTEKSMFCQRLCDCSELVDAFAIAKRHGHVVATQDSRGKGVALFCEYTERTGYSRGFGYTYIIVFHFRYSHPPNADARSWSSYRTAPRPSMYSTSVYPCNYRSTSL